MKQAGKTGTAAGVGFLGSDECVVCGLAKKEGYKDLAIAVVVENSGAGGTYAVPIAKKVFDVYFNK